MKTYKFIILVFSLFLILNFSLSGRAYATTKYNFTNEPDEEFIFMKLRRNLFTKTKQRDTQKAKFSIAEYYFKHNDFSDAFKDFKEYAQSNSPDETTLLANIYLYKICLLKNDFELADAFKKEIFNKPFVILFSEFKQLKYKSAFNNIYEIHYYLDNIKVFLNGEVFEEIKP